MSLFISEEVRSKNPNFSKLLDELTIKTENNHLSKVDSRFWLSKYEWLEEHQAFATVRLILNDVQLKIMNNELPEDQRPCWKAVMKCFYLNQCSDYLNMNELLAQNEVTVVDDLRRGKQLLAKEFHKKLESIAFELIDARDGCEGSENAKIRLARALQIGNVFKEDKSILFSNKLQLKKLNAEEVDLHVSYHQTGDKKGPLNLRSHCHLCLPLRRGFFTLTCNAGCQVLQGCADLLMKLITKYVLRLQPLKDQEIVKNALISCETFTAKLKSIRMDLKCETYSPKALEVLTKLRLEIIETIQRREFELADVEEQLAIFRKLGSGFDAIVKEYADTKNELERQQWTLSEVKRKLEDA